MVNLLIDFGVDIYATTIKSQVTALHIATETKKLELISLLVRRHANVNAKNEDIQTALHIAAENSLTSECALMIEYGANVNSKDDNGLSPLHYASAQYDVDTVKLLLDNNASVNGTGRARNPLLYIMYCPPENKYKLWRNFIAVITLLIKAGADPTGLKDCMDELKYHYPILQKMLNEPSNRYLKGKWITTLGSPSANVIEDSLEENGNYGCLHDDDDDGEESYDNDGYHDDYEEDQRNIEANIPFKEWIGDCSECKTITMKEIYSQQGTSMV
ncbi:unnamed protein product [Umbelopsis ramanniana]